MAEEQRRPRGIRRFFETFNSLNPWEMVSELIEEYALIRRTLFVVLLVLVWGNWTNVLGVMGIWALYEAGALLGHRIREWRERWLKRWRERKK